MKNFIKVITIFSLLFFSNAFGIDIKGVKVPNSIQNSKLILNGAGIRSKFFFDLYIGALYLEQKNQNAKEIIEADKAMDITLYITSSFISSEKMTNASREGFEKSTNAHIEPIKKEINQFMSVFIDKIDKGDIYSFSYIPEKGVDIYKNAKLLTTIKGLAFKKALFGIWLCDKPAQKSLKKKMLGI